VVITGTNFRLYTVPSSGYLGGDEPRTVQVWFDGREALDVLVVSATHVEAVPPAYEGDANQTAFPAVDVKVQNVDDNGALIGGEEATSVGAYTYLREALRPPTLETESPFVRISRRLLHLLKRQFMLDVSQHTHTDYSSDGIVLPDAPIPSLAMIGPVVTADAYGWENAQIENALPSGDVEVYNHPIQHTVSYTLMGRSDNEMEYQRMMGVARKFTRQNPYMLIAGDVPENSTIRLPMVCTEEPEPQSGVLNANLHVFTSTFEVRRIPVLYLPPHLTTKEVSTLQLEVQKVTGTLVETIIL
jgi:hypothetical protein